MSEPVVTVAEVKAACEGMLQKQLYVVLTKPTRGLGPVLENLKPHLAYQIDIEQRGIMVGAGPFWTEDEKQWMGEGMVIIRAASIAQAHAIAAADPMHKSGARSYTIRPWLLNEGSLNVRVTFSDRKATID
ncbi:MAG: hypothetical protein HY056_17625 [Proteobacteria bacterium]|nr:hypothetical protein [Pseudomonadota bacterium]